MENRRVIQERIRKGLTDIICVSCEGRIQLLDLIENRFSSEEVLQVVREMDRQARINLDKESQDLILIGHAQAVATEAGQRFHLFPDQQLGIDGEVEFLDYSGKPSNQKVLLHLRNADKLYKNEADGVQTFVIKDEAIAKHWRQTTSPIMLVVRSPNGTITWMNIGPFLRKQKTTNEGTALTVTGENFTALSLQKLRDKMIPAPKVTKK